MSVLIEAFSPNKHSAFLAHLERHQKESGDNGFHFMPFEPGSGNGPKGIDLTKQNWPLQQPGWQRSFLSIDTNTLAVVGHIHLKGNLIHSSLHRCWLELGIEAGWRQQGLGTKLMDTALNFARKQQILEWIDLFTFAHNTPALNLYNKLGFTQIGVTKDRFRIANEVINDIMMCYKL